MKKILSFYFLVFILAFSIEAQNYTVSNTAEKVNTKSIRIKSINFKGNELSIVLDFSTSDWSYVYASVKNSVKFGPPEKLVKSAKQSFLPRTQKDTAWSVMFVFLIDSVPNISELICECDSCFKFLGMSIVPKTYNDAFVKIDIPPTRKGMILLLDGTSYKFAYLKVENDMVVFTEKKTGASHSFHSSEVYKITKTRNYALSGALSCGLGALAGVFEGSKNSFPETGIIVGATIGGAIFGAIIGALIKKEKNLYTNTSAFK